MAQPTDSSPQVQSWAIYQRTGFTGQIASGLLVLISVIAFTALVTASPGAIFIQSKTALFVTLGSVAGTSFALFIVTSVIHELANRDIKKSIDTLEDQVNKIGTAQQSATPREQGQCSYFSAIKDCEREDIHFILKTLATKNPLSLGLMQTNLTAAGARIAHIHTLRFLLTIFLDPELNDYIHTTQTKTVVWNSFISPLKTSLTDAVSKGDMKDEYIVHFSQQLQLPYDQVANLAATQKWDDLINLLLITEVIA